MTITLLAPDGVAVTAQQERQARAAGYGSGAGRPLGGRSGFRVDTASNVLTVTSTTWTLTPCSAAIDPGASTYQGMYGWATDANLTGAVTASDVTYDRKDIVYIQVNDSSAGDGSGATSAPVLYLAGTPATTPAAPTLPPRSFLVGTITVPKTGGGSPSVVLNPARYVSAGAPLPVFSQAERDALVTYKGLTVQRADIAGVPLETWDGSIWQRFTACFAQATGKVAIGSVAAGAQVGPYAQTFPTGRFSVAPVVDVCTDQTRVAAVAANVTATGFDLYMGNWSPAASASGEMRWTAVQMTPTSATG